MTASAQLEQQLTALAAGIDRANKPTSLLSIPMLLIVVACFWTFWQHRSMRGAQALIDAKTNEVQEITKLVGLIKTERTKSVDIAKLYDKLPFFGSQVEEAWKQRNIPFRESPNLGNVTPSQILSNPIIFRSDVQVTINNDSFEHIAKAVDSTLKHEFLERRVFVSLAQLTPVVGGWRSTIRFSAYHVPNQ